MKEQQTQLYGEWCQMDERRREGVTKRGSQTCISLDCNTAGVVSASTLRTYSTGPTEHKVCCWRAAGAAPKAPKCARTMRLQWHEVKGTSTSVRTMDMDLPPYSRVSVGRGA